MNNPLPCCSTFQSTGEHHPDCRTPIYAKMAADRKARKNMKSKIEYRLWYKAPGSTIWERWSGGVKPNRDEWVRVANADTQRRDHQGLAPLQYAISKREVIDYGVEEI